jgi:molybdopterin-containing oxidoreductase family iron-sulfur binding subunit
MTAPQTPLDLAEVRARLAAARGKDYWRGLEELAQTEGFQELVQREFPRQAGEWTDAFSRRQFLTLMAASLGLAGLSGCTPAPPERIMPYVRQPEEIVLGVPLFFATTMPLAGDAQGLLVKSHEGRPTKVEGNARHPSSPKSPGTPEHVPYGPTHLFAQASILTLYDPDRSQAVTHLGDISTWDAFLAALLNAVGARRRVRLRVLTETVTSPTVAFQLTRLLQRFPAARWYVHEPLDRDNARIGARHAFGEAVDVQYQLDQADVILALDSDFLSCGPAHVKHLHDFALRRRVRGRQMQHMNRLYVAESTLSSTGAMADHHLPLRSGQVEALARAVAARLDERFRRLAADVPVASGRLDAIKNDLLQHGAGSLVVAGEGQPPLVHALAHAMNEFLRKDQPARTVKYTAPVAVQPASGGGLRELAEEMEHGQVDVLVVVGGNPVYTAPVDLHFGERMARVPFRVHLGHYADETSAACHWHIPEAHYLESWGDARAHDGTLSFIQPLIAPLYRGRTASELLAMLADQHERTSYNIVRAYYQHLFDRTSALHGAVRADWERQDLLAAFSGDFEAWWRRALHDGLVAGTQLPARSVTLQTGWMNAPGTPAAATAGDLEIVFRPDPTVYDGRFANNGWLQELPKPLSKLTWGNAAELSPATAVRLGLAPADHPEEANEKVVELEYRGQTLDAPVWVIPGHANDSITVHLGYGRSRTGRVGSQLGFNAYLLRSSSAPWFGAGALRPKNRRVQLAGTHLHNLMENRELVRSGTVQDPPHVPVVTHRLTLFNEAEHHHPGPQWGMVIDLNVCTGCSACVVACQAENNIPIVGKTEVQRGREMHWLRVDHYFVGGTDNPKVFFQPVPCMQCENAPCEQVCPVAATVHSNDGLNDMVYNRCVGTRYCSNNCPYKVRRFNFFQFSDYSINSLSLMHNPEVTVRSRGVMEKCTYCVQRIRTGEIAAHRDDRPLRDGDVQTACQAACPAGAIIFGNLTDHGAQVARLQSEPWRYDLLAELNTRPRTTYLAAVKNPNPAFT